MSLPLPSPSQPTSRSLESPSQPTSQSLESPSQPTSRSLESPSQPTSRSLELRGLRKAYQHGGAPEFYAVERIDLNLRLGECVVFAGPSGSGKTTLLSLIGCLTRPTEGRVLLDGQVISGLPEPFQAALRRETFGFVFQQFNLIRGLSVLENVILPAYPMGTPYRTLRVRAEALLEQLNLGHRRAARVETLSGGEAQRTAVARALINNPPILIADEPTANLDSHLSGVFLDIVTAWRNEGRTVLMSSHDPLIQQAPVVDRVVALRDGRIVADSAP